MKRLRASVSLLLACGALNTAAHGQASSAKQPTPLDSCIAAAGKKDFDSAERIAAMNIRSLGDSLARHPADVDALVSMARFIAQCRMPGVDQLRLGELSDQTIDVLARALAIAPTHWLARYLLALQYYRAPAFLGREGLAVQELERLLAQQGQSRAPATFARPYEYRGTLWKRTNKPDSARAVWARGLELFPADTVLQRLVRESAPAAPSSAPPPVAGRVRLAVAADTLFWRTLHAGAYDSIARVMVMLKAAYLQNPSDAETAAHIGMLHAWHIAERSRLAEQSPAITDDAILARRYLDLSMARAAHPDARTHGFAAVLTMIEGDIHQDTALAAAGLRNARASIAAWPEFNWFTVGYVLSVKPDTSAIFREALAMQWKAVDGCARTTVDRTNPTAELALGALRTEPNAMRRRACGNSWIAPHNLEGFFLNMGDMLVKSGDWRTAQRVYALAQGTHGVGDYTTWPYRDVLEARIRGAEQNVAAFKQGSAPMMFGSKFACSACHQSAITTVYK